MTAYIMEPGPGQVSNPGDAKLTQAVAPLIVILAPQVAVQVQMLPTHSARLTFYKPSQDPASISIKYAL